MAPRQDHYTSEQLQPLLDALQAVRRGDFSVRLPVDESHAAERSILADISRSFNDVVSLNERSADEMVRLSLTVGREGKMTERAGLKDAGGAWANSIDAVNTLVEDLARPTTEVARVITSVAQGDLSQKMALEIEGTPVKGEFRSIGATVNTMVDQLNSFAAEVTRVAREVGTEGKLGGQAEVPGVSGTWKDLTDNVNILAGNLTDQVRNIALVTTAVANGDLSQKITVDVQGEIAELKETINTMVDQLSSFAGEVTRVAREVGTEGKLGGQAEVPGVSGTWKDLTDNVNFMANSLTVQVRSISDVATAVAQGDLTRSITVETQGEVSELKDNINRMIANLKDTTQRNDEQDWLKTNLANFSRAMQGQKSLDAVSQLIMSDLTPLVSAHHGVFYLNGSPRGSEPVLRLLSSYGYRARKHVSNEFRAGEGLVGQCALEKKSILLTNVPPDYIQINSGLGEAPPRNIIVLPVLFEGELMAVIELASFQTFSPIHMTFLDQLMDSLGVVLNMIAANRRTEELLEQSQSLTQELQSQSQELQARQDELKSTNDELEAQARELEEKAALLAEQNVAVELKNREVELARNALEDKAEQLALSSKYKSEFLANMSHELRTPLNSMLILANLLANNQDGNLTPKQAEFAHTIYSSGRDLLELINEILDLSKVEAGRMEVEISAVPLPEVRAQLQRTFEHLAEQKGLGFEITIADDAPAAIRTDASRLQQILKNLLSNAFKFTEQGKVELNVTRAAPGFIAFAVSDSGVGIAPDKQQLIFEAFQQADGTTSRKFGGTGLGLSISREIARLLGGRITVQSEVGQGSTFTLTLPDYYSEPAAPDATPRSSRAATLVREAQAQAARETQSTRGAHTMSTPPPDTSFAFDISSAPNPLDDDRHDLQPGDRVLLTVEDDEDFARILMSMAREKGFKALCAARGDVGLAMARHFLPDAITLDILLPGMDGWAILDYLKRDPGTRHIPVQVISVMDRERVAPVRAISYLQKPVSTEALEGAFNHVQNFLGRAVKNLLLVEDDEIQRLSIVELIGDQDVAITAVETGQEALDRLAEHSFDCMILDLGLPDMAGFEVLKRVKQQEKYRDLPVIIHTSKDLTQREEKQLKKYAAAILTKDVTSSERLLDETAVFLHRVASQLPARPVSPPAPPVAPEASTPPPATFSPEAGAETDFDLTGHRVLVVDDDVRNVFALTSVLEANGMQVLFAEDGRRCLETLREDDAVEIVLMDVMMPGMDGYETTAAIRRTPGRETLPIIALTAKAMPEDRQKCLNAGASDYITKPVDTALLLRMIRFWLDRTGAQKDEEAVDEL